MCQQNWIVDIDFNKTLVHIEIYCLAARFSSQGSAHYMNHMVSYTLYFQNDFICVSDVILIV